MRAVLVICAAAMVGAGAVACRGQPAGASPSGRRGPPAFPVEVSPVASRAVDYSVGAVGSVEAYETVQVTARVAGAVDEVRFREGQQVDAGTVLVEIDPSRYRLAVASAAAALERADIARRESQGALARREAVQGASPGLIPGEELESFRATVQLKEAEWRAAQVAHEQARLNLRDAYVRAPVSGVLQTRSVQTGQFVQPGTVLATLLQRDPLLVRFRVPEAEAGRLRVGGEVTFEPDGERPSRGRITHVAASANESSRMVEVTAEVDPADRERLRPGAFTQVTAPVGSSPSATVVPQTAVRPSERGFLAYVVTDGKAEERVVRLGLRTRDGLVEVTSGLNVGEDLVVRGAEALRPGVQVRVEGGASPRAAGLPGGRP